MNAVTSIPSPIREINAHATRAPANHIDPDPRNPRTFINDNELAELAASIKERGLLQRILVRPSGPGRYLIVFGERRWRAFMLAHGADAEMPILVCDMTDDEALQAQIDENEIRVAPSETEQADAAARVLEACQGDRAEAIRRLAWSPSKFDRRIALTKLTPAVKAALNDRSIKVGHAELLAAVAPDKQDRALATIQANGIDVAATRDLLSRMTHALAAASFDKTECAGCSFNSNLQRTLFENAVEAGACTNPTCYELKEAEAKKTLSASPQKPPQATKVQQTAIADKKSRAPAPTVATASTVAEKSAPIAPANEAAPPVEFNPNPEPLPVHTEAMANPVAEAPQHEPEDDERVAALRSACRRKSQSLRESLWRRALARHLAETPAHATLALTLAGFTGHLSSLTRTTLPDRARQLIAPEFSRQDRPRQLAAIIALDGPALERAHSAIAAAFAIDVPDFNSVEALSLSFKIDIRSLWTVDKSYLDRFTKDELTFIALESGFTSTIGAKEFSRLAKAKRDDLIKAMLNTPAFKWTGRLPSAMTIDGRYGAPPLSAPIS